MGPDAAVILAGGAGRRMAGQDKPALRIGGQTLLEIALAAVRGARVVVVGPARPLPDGVLSARESPPGGGPAAALAAGLGVLGPESSDLVAVLAADLPGVTGALLGRLVQLLEKSGAPGALAVDATGRGQLLVGIWRAQPLTAAIATRPSWHGASMRELLEPLGPVMLTAPEREVADLDTPADLDRWRRAEP